MDNLEAINMNRTQFTENEELNEQDEQDDDIPEMEP